MRCRYRLQRREPCTLWDRTGRPTPVHTYRWTDIAMSDGIEELAGLLGGELPKDCRIIDTDDHDRVVRAGRR